MTPETAELVGGLLLVGVGFWLGAIPFGVVVGRHLGVDVQDSGSGNIGATNVARTVGKKAGAFVLVLDAIKGAVPILIWRFAPQPTFDPNWIIAIGLAPIVGHCFSPWLRFAGGKGVATALGVFLALNPFAALVGFATFAVVYVIFRVASPGSLLGAASIAITIGVRGGSRAELWMAIAAAVLILVRHRGNIARLFKRIELRV